jgi:hypothetical protein
MNVMKTGYEDTGLYRADLPEHVKPSYRICKGSIPPTSVHIRFVVDKMVVWHFLLVFLYQFWVLNMIYFSPASFEASTISIC